MKTKILLPMLALCVALAPIFANEVVPEPAPAPVVRDPIMKVDDPSWNLDFTVAEQIAVQEDRRKKPLQTYAFESIEQMYGRPLMGSTFAKVPVGDRDNPKFAKMSAIDLYFSIWFFPHYWYDKPLILVANNELRKQLVVPAAITGLDAAENAGIDQETFFDEKRMSVKDLTRGPLFTILKGLQGKEEAKLSAAEKEAKLLSRRIEIFEKIASSFGFENGAMLAMVPHPSDKQGAWGSLRELFDGVREYDPAETKGNKLPYKYDDARKACESYIAMRDAYKARDNEKFAQTARDFKNSLQKLSPTIYPTDTVLQTEVQYNNDRPFAKAWIFYLLAGMMSLLALKARQKPIYATAMALYLIGLGLHIYGFALRCYIAGRPPVSNMYESVIWVGFGVVFFGLIFETIYRKRYYMIAGSFGGFLCLVLMDLVPVIIGNSETPGFESQLKPLQPVLRDNFWLTVHVLTITLSYAAFMLAWGMGHIALLSHLTRPDERVEHRELHNLVYRVMQVGVLLLSIGTILGGVWAYYSWGRFWGWDPKETWAFIALMCYIIVLHGRFAGLWTNFGLAFGSVFCFQAIVMAWYGVNFVLPMFGNGGKHAYGAGAGGLVPVSIAVAVDMLFLAAATTQYLLHRKKKNLPPPGSAGSSSDDGDEPDESARGRVDDPPDNA